MPITPLATLTECERYMSAYGIVSWADHDGDLANDDNVFEDVQTYGTAFIVGRLVHRYTFAQLQLAEAITEIACVIILRELTLRRGNPPPASLEMRYQEIVQEGGELDQIAKGKILLVDSSGLPLQPATTGTPSWSNLRIDRRHAERQVRVVDGSSHMRPTTQRRDVDHQQNRGWQ